MKRMQLLALAGLSVVLAMPSLAMPSTIAKADTWAGGTHATTRDGSILVSIPCSPPRSWTLPKGLTLAQEEVYAFAHPNEAVVTPCKRPTELALIARTSASGDDAADRYSAAQVAYNAAIDRGASQTAAVSAGVDAFDAPTVSHEAIQPGSDRPLFCSTPTPRFTYNYDTVPGNNGNTQAVVEWELWYQSGTGCYTFQQTEYQFVHEYSSTWVQGSWIDNGALSVGPCHGGSCYVNIPVTWNYGNGQLLALDNFDNTWYCTAVDMFSKCFYYTRHPDDLIPN